MRDQETSTRSKATFSKKETLYSTTLQEEGTSILTVDSKDREEEEVWAEAEEK
jgi:hypothetical protein